MTDTEPEQDEATEEQRTLDELKALCVEGESETEHAEHAEALADAYAAFAARPLSDSGDEPGPREVQLTAHIAAAGGASA